MRFNCYRHTTLDQRFVITSSKIQFVLLKCFELTELVFDLCWEFFQNLSDLRKCTKYSFTS